MSVQREQAQRHLLGLATLAFGGRPPLRQDGPQDLIDAKRRARMDAAAAALVELGALTEADAAPFRERLEEAIAARDRYPPAIFDERLAARARALLEQRLEAVRDGPDLPRMPPELEHPPPPHPEYKDAVSRFGQLYSACEACRALPTEELSEWSRRLLEADDGRAWHLERERRQKRFTLTELRAVIPGPPARRGQLRITTAELYADGVVLRWHEAGGSLAGGRAEERGARRREAGRRSVSLSDDLGTRYLHFHTSEAHSHAAVLWTAEFATPVPGSVRELIAEIRDERFVMALGSQGASP